MEIIYVGLVYRDVGVAGNARGGLCRGVATVGRSKWVSAAMMKHRTMQLCWKKLWKNTIGRRELSICPWRFACL